jgi:hypothetical protein
VEQRRVPGSLAYTDDVLPEAGGGFSGVSRFKGT